MKIIADAHIPYVTDYFASYGELVLIPGRQMTHADVKDADIVLVRSVTRVDKALLDNTSVKFVGSVTAGKDHLAIDFLEKAGIAWCAADGFNAPPVAEYVVSVIAALQRQQLLRQDQKRALVVGLGQTGRLTAERLALLGMDIIPCDPVRAENEKEFVSVNIDDVHEVDVITLHVPLTETGPHATRHLIDQSILKRLRPGCVLLNASRGEVINTEDLIKHGQHLHWCFDVFAQEPNIDKYLLQQAAIATPHIAGYSVQSKMRGIDMIYRAACAKKIITQKALPPLPIPRQQLTFSGRHHHWQDIVLGIFNPLTMTAMMRSLLLPAPNTGELFDRLRNQFTYRHEFAFTEVDADIEPADQVMVGKLGVGSCLW